MKEKKQKIVLTGGGTAGHVYPALAVAEKLQDYEIHYIGGNGIEKEIISKFPEITFHEISTVKFQRKITFQNLLIPFKLLKSISQSEKILKEISPNIIFSKGGFVAVPIALAGKRLKIPVVSHESDLSFGLANKIILHYCSVMCTTFEKTSGLNKKCIYTGQPIRQKIFQGKKLNLDFDKNLPTLLVLGGSLGAKFLNDIVFENIDKITKKFNIVHISGKNNFKEINHKNYLTVAYAENIEDLYATADIVLSRSGSGVINELLALNKPMLLIPLSKKCSRGDQIENAKLFNELGFAEMLEEENYNYKILEDKLIKLTKNKEKIEKNMQKTSKNNAVDEICSLIKKYEK